MNIDKIIWVVSQCTGVSEVEIKGKNRRREVCEARFIAMDFIRIYNPNRTLASIGSVFGGDHASVIYGRGVVADLLKSDRQFRTKYELIEQELKRVPRLLTP